MESLWHRDSILALSRKEVYLSRKPYTNGAVIRSAATEAHFVTTNTFTKASLRYAEQAKGLFFVDLPSFVELIKQVL